MFVLVLAALFLFGVLDGKKPDPGADSEIPLVSIEPPAVPRIGLKITESLVLDRDLEFSDRSLDRLLVIEGDGVTLDCRGCRIAGKARRGIFLKDASNVTIRDCVVEGPSEGLFGNEVKQVKILGGRFRVEKDGIRLLKSDGVIIEGVELRSSGIEKMGMAVEIIESTDVKVRRCRIRDFGQGVLLVATRDFTVKENDIRNIIETGIGTFQDQLHVSARDGRILGNTIEHASMGLEIDAGSHDIKIERNTIRFCEIWLRMSDARGTRLFNPVFDIFFVDNIIDQERDPFEVDVRDPSRIHFSGTRVLKD